MSEANVSEIFYHATTLPFASSSARLTVWTASAVVQFTILMFLTIFGTLGNILVIVTISKASYFLMFQLQKWIRTV